MIKKIKERLNENKYSGESNFSIKNLVFLAGIVLVFTALVVNHFYGTESITGFSLLQEKDFSTGKTVNTAWDGENITLSASATKGYYESDEIYLNYSVQGNKVSFNSSYDDTTGNVTVNIMASSDNYSWSSWSKNITNGSAVVLRHSFENQSDFRGISSNIDINTDNISLSSGEVNGSFISNSFEMGLNGLINRVEFNFYNKTENQNLSVDVGVSNNNESWSWTSVEDGTDPGSEGHFMKFRVTLTSNDTTDSPHLESLSVNYKANFSYFKYRIYLFSTDTSKTPYFKNFTLDYSDAENPLIEFAQGNETQYCTSINDIFLNFTITEFNEDSLIIHVNNTNYTFTNQTHNLNLSNVSEGIYLFYGLVNDSEGNTNQTLLINYTIDLSNPTAFNLTNPSNSNRSTSTTPFFRWDPTIDTCFDNYTIEISEDELFTTLYANFSNITNSYQTGSSEAFARGTYYWRVKAFDKLGNSYITANWSFEVGESAAIYSPPSLGTGSSAASSSGGGGGSKVVGVDIIEPGPVSFAKDDELILPIDINNYGTKSLRNVTVYATSEDLLITVTEGNIETLYPGEKRQVELIINPQGKIGRFPIVIYVKSNTPSADDSAKLFVDLFDFATGKGEGVDQIEYAKEFVLQNDVCFSLLAKLNLTEDVMNDENAILVAEEVINECKALLSQSQLERLDEKNFLKSVKMRYYLLAFEVFVFIFIVIWLFSYLRRRKILGKHKK